MISPLGKRAETSWTVTVIPPRPIATDSFVPGRLMYCRSAGVFEPRDVMLIARVPPATIKGDPPSPVMLGVVVTDGGVCAIGG